MLVPEVEGVLVVVVPSADFAVCPGRVVLYRLHLIVGRRVVRTLFTFVFVALLKCSRGPVNIFGPAFCERVGITRKLSIDSYFNSTFNDEIS